MSSRQIRQRLQFRAVVGAVPILFALVLLETNEARMVAAAVGLAYAAFLTFWVMRAARRPK